MCNMVYIQWIWFQAIQIQYRIRFRYSIVNGGDVLKQLMFAYFHNYLWQSHLISSKTVYDDAASVMFKYCCADLVTVRQQMLNNKYTGCFSRNPPYFRVYDKDRARGLRFLSGPHAGFGIREVLWNELEPF